MPAVEQIRLNVGQLRRVGSDDQPIALPGATIAAKGRSLGDLE
jgi:hypothetical protein